MLKLLLTQYRKGGETMKQINIRVDDKIGGAFYEFCKDQGITPYELLSSIIGFYGRGKMLTQKMDDEALSQEEVLVELGHIISDMQRFSQANGEFLEAIAVLLKPYGIDFDNLWPNLRVFGEKTQT
jgi:hypothetical protein